jgi:hypothetical protein
MKFLRKLKDYDYYLVGFNCIQFDAQVIQYMINNYDTLKRLKGEEIAKRIHDVAQAIINLPDEEKWSQLIPEWKLTMPQIDVYKQNHYDSKNKRTSLKWLEFTMRFPNIESMPVRHDEFITEDMIPAILAYNHIDVEATEDFFTRTLFETELRSTLSQEYNLNLLNASEPRMARDIFGTFLSERMGIMYRDLKELRTFRNRIYVRNLLFPYVRFKDPILKAVKTFFQGLDFNPYNFEENNYNLSSVTSSFKFHNLQVDVGLGGIHGCISPGVYEANENWSIEDIDGKSYYPNLGIKNNLFPQHLSKDFCIVTDNLYKMRTQIAKDSPINYIFKIILNSAYGLSKEPNNYFHDPAYTFAITINGQLLLLMLAEIIRAYVPGVIFYQFNTDGVTIGYNPVYKAKVEEAKKIWENITKIELENNFYKKMVIRDVNAYLAVDIKDKIKRKNIFAYSLKPEDKELQYHKNLSFLIVPKALEAYFVHGVPYEDYIMSCKDIYDFCGGVKVKRDFNLLEYSYNKAEQKIDKKVIKQQVVRYYVTTETTSLKKKYKAGSKMDLKAKSSKPSKSKKEQGVVELENGWNTKYFNQYVKKEMKDYNIDYRYYIRQVRDIIDNIQPNISNLKLF